MAPQSEYDTLSMVEAAAEAPKGRSSRKAVFVAAVLLAAGCVGYFASGTADAAVTDVADVSADCHMECINGWPNAEDQDSGFATNQCQGCDPGYYLSGFTCNAYSAGCENGTPEPVPNADFDCLQGGCNAGYYWWANGDQGVCTGYEGSCSNGWLDGQSARDGENDCGGCANGHYLTYDGAIGKCTPYGGACPGGYIQPQTSRNAENDCGSCEGGYFLQYSGNQGYCTAYGGSCSNGALMEPASTRIADNYCGSCNAGYYLSNGHCSPYGGSCSNGQLASQSARTQENHCGSCNDGYTLVGGTSCQVITGSCANGSMKPAGTAVSSTDCGSCNAGYWYDEEPSPGATSDDESSSCGGACSSGWSSSEITNVGTAGNMHGPWGNDVRSVSKTFTIPSGISQCSVTWDSWGFSSRDNEVDYVYIDGSLVWSQAQSCGSMGSTTNGNQVSSYLGSYCWGSCSGYTIKNSNSWSGSCSGTITLLFTSNIDQAENDEGWGFNNVVVTYGDGAAGMPQNCAAIGATSSGTYTIYPDGANGVSVWCDMDTDGGGYDSVLVTGGATTCGSTSSNSCPSGMNIFVPRTQAHYAAIISKWGSTYIDGGAVGISSATEGPGCCGWQYTSYAMNSNGGTPFRAVDGGTWWLRDSSYNEPNGDYSSNCWLDMYNVNNQASDMRFNDGWCGACYSQYVCSTNAKDGTLSHNVGVCNPYGGSCSNGVLRAQGSRTADNQCGDCNPGYYLSGTTCYGWGGSCSYGTTKAQAERTGHNQCESCNSGYYMSGTSCVAYGGSCANGQLATQSQRMMNDQCDVCSAGYELMPGSPATCSGYAGECANGVLMPQYARTTENHCGSCDAGYYLTDTTCTAYAGDCTNGVIRDQSARTADNQCQSCDDGYYLTGTTCTAWAGACTNGVLKPQSERTQDNHCGACDEGFELGGDTQPSDYTANLSGYDYTTTTAVAEGMAITSSAYARTLTDIPGEVIGSIFYQPAGALAQTSNVAVSPNYPTDVYIMTAPDDAGTHNGLFNGGNLWDQDGGWTQLEQQATWTQGSAYEAADVCSGTAINTLDGVTQDDCRDACTQNDDCTALNFEAADTGVEDGAVADGWSNSKITNVGARGNVHGPWGNDVREVSKTYTVPAGVSQCTVTWKSFSLHTRDNEADKLYVDGTEVWTKNGNMNWDPADGTNWGDFSDANGNAGMYEGSVTAACSGTVELKFTSAIDQAIGDEGWAFSDVAIDFGVVAGTGTCSLYSSTFGTRRLSAAHSSTCESKAAIAGTGPVNVFKITIPAGESLTTALTVFPGVDVYVGIAVDNTGTSCDGCAAGYHQMTFGCIAWAGSCANGIMADQQDRTQEDHCGLCDDGYYLKEGACVAFAGSCPNGQLADQAARKTENYCGSCDAGYALVTTSYTPFCQACNPGTYSTGTEACTNCAPGYYQPNSAQSECMFCAPGTIAEAEGFATCHTCGSDGMEPNEARTLCSACPAGSAATDGMAACVDCEIGYHAAVEGMAHCAICNPGTVQPATAGTECVDCDVGTYYPTFAGDVCVDCAPGTVQAEVAADHCDACVPGKVQPAVAQTECVDCAVGYYMPSYQQTKCPACAPGQIAPEEGMAQCVNCEAGKQQHQYGQGECIDCAVGHVAPVEGMVYCNDCVPGKHQDQTGQLECKACAERESTCDDDGVCDLGTWTGWYAAVNCVDHTVCPPGDHIDFEGSLTADRTCVDCEPEHWNPRDNNPTCTEWTVCAGSADADYDGAFEGLAVLGTPTTDAVCEACEYGKTSLIDDFYSPCYQLTDLDGDGLFDRFDYDDIREQGERAASLGRTPFVARTDFDKREDPGTGGAYDRCPFDYNNDEDEDGICHGPTPSALAYFMDDSAGTFYAPGGSRNDLCPYDPTNDLDKDGFDLTFAKAWRCDEWDFSNDDMAKEGVEPISCKMCDDTDKLVQTMNFHSNNLMGWTDEGAVFEATSPQDELLPSLGRKMFAADMNVDHVCAKADEYVMATFTTPHDSTCDAHCANHGMVCAAGKALPALCQDDCNGEPCAYCDDTGCCTSDRTGEFCKGENPGASMVCAGASVLTAGHGYTAVDDMCKRADDMSASDCAEPAPQVLCRCEADPEPVKTLPWSQQDVCPSCFAGSKANPEKVGSMTTEIKIKKNTLLFAMAAAPAANKFVKLTVKNKQAATVAKALKGMPSIVEFPSSTADEWYPVEWDVSQYIGQTAVLEVADFDPAGGIDVDSFTLYNDYAGCLPACMAMRVETCQGETCFYFENDSAAYVRVKSKNDNDGMFCREVDPRQGGSPIGPALKDMGMGAGSNIAPMDLAYLGAVTKLPRCLNIDIRGGINMETGEVGGYYGISVASGELGATQARRVFAFESQPLLGDDAFCAYPTLKPRCMDYTKATSAFSPRKRTTCRLDMYEPSCFDQCYSIHCPLDGDGDDDPCAKKKAFDDCATCCDNNDNVASGCFRRRRRRLGAAVVEIGADDVSAKVDYTDNECAAACLTWVSPNTCIGYRNDNGVCMLTTYCNNVPEEKRPEEERGAGYGNFEKATWSILDSISNTELFWAGENAESGATPKKRKRRVVKKPPAPVPVIMDGAMPVPEPMLGPDGEPMVDERGLPVLLPVLVGGDQDGHGCLGSAGFEWCEAKAKCFRWWEEDCPATAAVDMNAVCAADATADGCFTITQGLMFVPGSKCTQRSSMWYTPSEEACAADPACTGGGDSVTLAKPVNTCTTDLMGSKVKYVCDPATGALTMEVYSIGTAGMPCDLTGSCNCENPKIYDTPLTSGCVRDTLTMWEGFCEPPAVEIQPVEPVMPEILDGAMPVPEVLTLEDAPLLPDIQL